MISRVFIVPRLSIFSSQRELKSQPDSQAALKFPNKDLGDCSLALASSDRFGTFQHVGFDSDHSIDLKYHTVLKHNVHL